MTIAYLTRFYDDGTEAFGIFPGFGSVICLVLFCVCANTAIKVRIAPKVYVIEYTAKLLKRL